MEAKTIEDLLTLTITDLTRLGLLRRGETHGGGIEWKRNGTRIGSIYVVTDCTREVAKIRLIYDHNGNTSDYTTLLRFKLSNLGNGGYYYFTCPVTGRSCRKLYLVGGRFISRYAFTAVYAKQRWSKKERADVLNGLLNWQEYERLKQQRHRKPYYRGKLTPYGKQLQKYEQAAAAVADLKRAGMIYATNNKPDALPWRKLRMKRFAPEIMDIFK